jgi:hypothetical protein
MDMKRIKTVLLVVSSLIYLQSFATKTLILDGIYQGKNLYVQNPITNEGVGFSVFQVSINGEVTINEVNSSSFEIMFENVPVNIGDEVEVKIKYKDGNNPRILNPEVLLPRSTFEITSVNVTKNGVYEWSSTNEKGKLTYIIEQFKWNSWVKVGEVNGKGKEDVNEYQFNIIPHSGLNKVRVKQIDYTNKPRYSYLKEFISNLDPVSFTKVNKGEDIVFSDKTFFEVYNYHGKIIKLGYNNHVNISDLPAGEYNLNYDNVTGNFTVK